MKKNPLLIRKGDRVRVVVPQVAVRVGYPKTVSDYYPEVEAKYGKMLREDMDTDGPILKKAIHAIAYGIAKADGFGGRDRTLHLKEVPEMLGQEFTVFDVRQVQTGRYHPSVVLSTNYYGEHDYEPAGLADMKCRRLVRVGFQWKDYEIPVEHLEKLP